MTATVTFERVGRSHAVGEVTVESTDPAVIAEHVHRHVKPLLRSKAYDVDVVLHADGTGTCLIEGGRFGRGTVEVVEAPAPVEGWWWPINARKAHYMVGLTSLCGKWMTLGNPTLDPTGNGPDDCAACTRKLAAR